MKDIVGYEGLYAITEDGQVWSYRRQIFLKLKTQTCGYTQTTLHKDGVRKQFLVHRLVALAFLPNPNNLPEVNHKDENKKNNHVSNLEWCDRNYNMSYGNISQKISDGVRKHQVRAE